MSQFTQLLGTHKPSTKVCVESHTVQFAADVQLGQFEGHSEQIEMVDGIARDLSVYAVCSVEFTALEDAK
jgi:hypothetical protein